MEFDADFRDYINDLKKKKDVIIAGDINVVHTEKDIYLSSEKTLDNKITPGLTLQERKSFESLLATGWVDTFRDLHPNDIKYTWWNQKITGRKHNVGSRIDYVLVN